MKHGSALSPSNPLDSAALADDAPTAKDRNVEEWAAVVAALSAVPRPEAPISLPAEAASWRAGDGSLTPAAAAPADANSETGPSKDTTHVDLRVDAADLGQIDIAVDRLDTGVRVTIAAADERAIVALEPERARLLAVLHDSGVRVDSVTVVRAGASGMGLAQGPGRGADASRISSREDTQARKRSQKKNHFVG
ncbi:MAG TPA: flagellar hook-length control protein FliK [Polyangiaceae bacterium]|nr:flagellar hook-length control protein FliK [Polyangiaceae bacterium]